MKRGREQLREDALAIWHAGVEAVRSERLIQEVLRVEAETLFIADQVLPLEDIGRIVVVGAGKAGAGMAAGVEQALGPEVMATHELAGWINVPADCVRPLDRIHLHAARPAGVNEPTTEGVAGTEEILRLVGSLGPRDLCLCLLSGGGSALLPAPVEGITLADKQAVTRQLSAAGANIHHLNTVRKQLSRIKGGGLLRACWAGRLLTLIISDVIGDPLDVIASGPTVPNPTTAADALAVLNLFGGRESGLPEAVFRYLERGRSESDSPSGVSATNLVIGNNARAVDAAGEEAVRRGYSPAMVAATELEGQAEAVGRHLADMARLMRDQPGPDCLISGGEPVVQLIDAKERGRGGRNQQLALAATVHLGDDAADLVLLSGGTDGEDGPTDAAGAIIDAETNANARGRGFEPEEFLRRNDAYHFFEPLDGLIKTGPTHTNVCDVRVVVVARNEEEERAG